MEASGPVLRDIHLPAEPGWWPPAPGWWLLGVLLLAVVGWAWRHVLRRRAARRRRAAVLAEVQLLRTRWLRDGDTAQLAAGLSQFLRRLSRQVQPASVALSGEDWLAFLARHGNADALRGLVEAAFNPAASLDVDAACDAVRRHAELVLAREWRNV